jgi:hypothetical protein
MDFSGKSLRIINSVSGYGLLAGSHGTNPGDRNMFQYPLTDTGPNPRGFEWMLMACGDNYYWIINRVSGHGLLAGSHGTNPGDRAVWQYPLTETGPNADGFKWSLEPSGDGFRIVNKVSGYGLLAGSHGTNPGDRAVWQYPLTETGPNENGFVWKLDTVGVFDVPKLRTPETQLDVPRVKSFADAAPDTSEPWVIGEVLVPFMFVADGPRSSQLRTTPYYVLSRERYWTQAADNEYDGKVQKTWTEEITVGMKETHQQSLENELSITITADASFAYGPATASMKTEIANKLKVSESSSTEKMRQEKVTTQVTVPKERVRIVIWVRTDRYSLKRTDGKLVSDPSVVLNKTHIVNDSFPAIASNAPAAPAITS